ncbi:MAG: MFS transporter [Alcaligenaceae bacterium]|nr:MAG: MFS transporter [Alcaligenaceae bacterium]
MNSESLVVRRSRQIRRRFRVTLRQVSFRLWGIASGSVFLANTNTRLTIAACCPTLITAHSYVGASALVIGSGCRRCGGTSAHRFGVSIQRLQVSLRNAEPSTTSPSSRLCRQSGLLFFPIGLLARLPFAMLTLGISSYVAVVRDSYSQGGLAAGSYALGASIGGAIAGSCADRFGQSRVINVLVVANSLSIAATLSAAQGSLAVLLVASGLCGLTIVPVGPFARVRWTAIVNNRVSQAERSKAQSAAFGYETLADEMTFVFGPVIVGLLARVYIGTPLIACVGIVLVFGFMFGRHRTVRALTNVVDHTHAAESLRGFFRRDRAALVVSMIIVGALLGALMNSVVAFSGEHGAVADAGLIYAGFGIGSGVASIGIGALRTRLNVHQSWLIAAIWSVLVCLAIPMIESSWLLGCALTLLGLGIGPVIVTIYEIAATRTPAGRETLYMTILSSAMIAGNALGAPTAGTLAERHGSLWGFGVDLVLSIMLLCMAILYWGVSRSDRTRDLPYAK